MFLTCVFCGFRYSLQQLTNNYIWKSAKHICLLYKYRQEQNSYLNWLDYGDVYREVVDLYLLTII